MAFDWYHYYQFADWLYQNPLQSITAEANHRIVVGRAYYGVFNICRDFLEARGHVIDENRAHAEVHEIFKTYAGKSHIRKAYMDIAYDLRRLRQLRNQADYDSHYTTTPGDAQQGLGYAARILRAIEFLTKNTP